MGIAIGTEKLRPKQITIPFSIRIFEYCTIYCVAMQMHTVSLIRENFGILPKGRISRNDNVSINMCPNEKYDMQQLQNNMGLRVTPHIFSFYTFLQKYF